MTSHKGISACFDRRSLSAERASELFKNHYKKFPVNVQFEPTRVFFYALIQMCLPQIN
jgi:hypothetical protein